MGFVDFKEATRKFVVSYASAQKSEEVTVKAKDKEPLPRTPALVRTRTMNTDVLKENLKLIDRTINDLHYPKFGPQLPPKATMSESDVDILLEFDLP
jgi:hypothetical protein